MFFAQDHLNPKGSSHPSIKLIAAEQIGDDLLKSWHNDVAHAKRSAFSFVYKMKNAIVIDERFAVSDRPCVHRCVSDHRSGRNRRPRNPKSLANIVDRSGQGVPAISRVRGTGRGGVTPIYLHPT